MNWSAFLTLGILTSSIHWIVARSEIMRPFWGLNWLPDGRVRGFLDGLLSCPACSGFWLGLGLGAAGLQPITVDFLPIDVLCSGLIAVWCTPVFEGVLLRGLNRSRMG